MKHTLLILLVLNTYCCNAAQQEIGLEYKSYLSGVSDNYENSRPIHIFYNYHFAPSWSIGAKYGHRPSEIHTLSNHKKLVEWQEFYLYGNRYFPLSAYFEPYISLGAGVHYAEVENVYNDGHKESGSDLSPLLLGAEVGTVFHIARNMNARMSLSGHNLTYDLEDGVKKDSLGVSVGVSISYAF